MRRFIISTLSSSSSRLTANYHRHRNGGYVFSSSLTTVSDRSAPPRDGGRNYIAWLMNMQKHHCFISTLANPVDTTSRNNESNMRDEEKDAIRVQVISREHVKPSSPTPENLRYHKLSIFDQMEAPIYHPLMFFYQNHTHNDNKNIEDLILDRSNHLKQSLSETLTRIYPFAGKVASELHVNCNDDGVYYVETRVDDRLSNVLKKKPDYKFLQRLIPGVDSSDQQVFGSYVTMVQVNFFRCGGVCITVQHNHKFADGRSSMIFLNTWASIARRDPNQVYPSFVTSSMFPQNPNLPFSPYIPIWYLTISPALLKHGKPANARFVFNALALQELKAKASKDQPVSRVVAVLAFLWKCVNAETQSKPSILHLPVNIRSRCSPNLPEYTIGNSIMGTYTKFDPKTSNSDVASMASQLKNAIEDVNDESVDQLRGENGHVRFVENLKNSRETFSDYKTEYYMTSSMCNLGTKEADFGWGKPVWSCTGNQLNDDIPIFINRMLLMDSCSGDGIEVWMTLEKQVMDAVKCNPELLSFASVDPSPL